MTERTGGEGKFSELFGVITRYSQGDHDHQEKASVGPGGGRRPGDVCVGD